MSWGRWNHSCSFASCPTPTCKRETNRQTGSFSHIHPESAWKVKLVAYIQAIITLKQLSWTELTHTTQVKQNLPFKTCAGIVVERQGQSLTCCGMWGVLARCHFTIWVCFRSKTTQMPFNLPDWKESSKYSINTHTASCTVLVIEFSVKWLTSSHLYQVGPRLHRACPVVSALSDSQVSHQEVRGQVAWGERAISSLQEGEAWHAAGIGLAFTQC